MAEPVFDNAVKWIWDAGKCGRKDSYKAFRKTFDLEEVPGVAAIQISADSTK